MHPSTWRAMCAGTWIDCERGFVRKPPRFGGSSNTGSNVARLIKSAAFTSEIRNIIHS
jgi:hypothetical protein